MQGRHPTSHCSTIRALSSAGRNVAVRAARRPRRAHRRPLRDRQPRFSPTGRRFRRSGADCVGRPQPLDVTAGQPARNAPSPRPAPHDSDTIRPRTSTPITSVCRRPNVAVAYRREVFDDDRLSLTRPSTPARTWSSTTASPAPACVLLYTARAGTLFPAFVAVGSIPPDDEL